MKKIVQITLLALLCGITTLAWAQPDENPETVRPAAREKIKALRIGFFTEKLDLQPAESEKFWVLYNEFATQQQKFNQEQKTKPNFAAMTDAEAEKAVAKHLDIRQRELDLPIHLLQTLRQTDTANIAEV